MRYHKSSHVRYRKLMDEGVVVQQAAGEVLVLNDTGLRVLELIDSGLGLEEITTQLAAEFAVETAQAAQDLAVYVRELQTAGVIEPVS